MRSLQEAEGQLVIVRHVELEKSDSLAVGFSHVLDWVAACCGETVGEIELFGYFGNWELAKRIVYLVDANRGEANWS
jgi:hypothetical protein